MAKTTIIRTEINRGRTITIIPTTKGEIINRTSNNMTLTNKQAKIMRIAQNLNSFKKDITITLTEITRDSLIKTTTPDSRIFRTTNKNNKEIFNNNNL
jgi:hypothetical protein